MMSKATLTLFAVAVAALSQAGSFNQYGNVALNPGGDAFRLTADSSLVTSWAGVYYNTDAGTTLNDLTDTSADFNWLQGRFGGGAPRFSIGFSDNTELHIYWGTGPNFDDTPAAGWQNTGNLLAATDNRFDTSQLVGGTFYDSGAHAFSAYGTKLVDYVSLDLDAGWAVPGGVQQMDVRTFGVNGNFQAVPEPATMAVLGLGALGMIRRRRAKK